MKIKIIIILVSSIVLTSCSKNKSKNKLNKSEIVLQKFYDIVSNPTLDESKLTEFPRQVNLINDMTPAKNQGSRGTCTIFATMGIIEAAIKKDLKTEVNLSEEYLNYSAQNYKEDKISEGVAIIDSLMSVNRDGLILESDWSYQHSWFNKGLPCSDFDIDDEHLPSKCFTHNRPNSNAMNRRFNADNIKFKVLEKDTNNIIEFLATYKRPLLMTVMVNFNGWKDSGETNYNEKLRQECINSPDDCGLHVIVITGYDMDKRVFMFKNSWGKSWGDNGYGTMPFDSVDNYVEDDLYMAMIEGELKIPEIEKSQLNILNLDVSTLINTDKSITINIDSKIVETGGKQLSLSNYLVKKHKKNSQFFPDDSNSEFIHISDSEERKIVPITSVGAENKYFISEEENFLNLESKNNSSFTIHSSFFSLPTVEELIKSKDFDFFLRTAIYLQTDDENVLIKNIFSPIEL